MREVKPTQKPVPSSDIKDLFFNSGLLDIWATSLEHKYIDRFGSCHLTAAGMEWLFKELVEKFKVDMNTAIVAAGYITIDSFQQGADLPNNELTQRNHILRDETTGEYYRWDGDLPKQVPAGSTPESTGGIGKGAWVSVGDASFRSDVKSGDGSLIGVGNNLTLKDKLSDLRSVRDYGVAGDGTDESAKLQLAIDSGTVRIPNGMQVTHGDIFIPKGTEFHFGVGASLVSTKKDAIQFEKDERISIVGAYGKGDKSVTLSEAVSISGYTIAHVISGGDTSDPWYIANANDPDELGYTGEVMKIKSIDGDVVTFETGLPFDITQQSYIALSKGKKTHFFGGEIINGAQGSTHIYDALNCSDIYFHNTTFDFRGNGGCRHSSSHNIHYINSVHKNRVGGGCMFFAYGSTDCTVLDSTFIGGVGGDAQVIAYAGCRRIISQRNKYLAESDNTFSIGLYFGAKTIGCKSIDDYFVGGKYGFYSSFGAMHFDVIRPTCRGQINAGIFCQDSQYFNVDNPSIDIIVNKEYTKGCIVTRGCDYFDINNNASTMNAGGGYLYSAYNKAGNQHRNSMSPRISIKGEGDVYIATPMSDMLIVDCDVNGAFSTYYSDGRSVGKFINNKFITATLHSIQYSDFYDNEFKGDGVFCVKFTGASRFVKVRRNKLNNALVGFDIPVVNASLFSIALYDDNEWSHSVSKFSSYNVRQGTKPTLGLLSGVIPPKNFFLPTNEWQNDTNTERTVAGYRHKGTNTGTTEDWRTIHIRES
ncbi:hypothetical protein J9231_05070 [Providencia rettgeri]|uniref:tail fiber/spike domain-containing protein n=1 Tax=Providencia rettgeri TaxID=587 RepID=UPI001B384D8E|nr:hypothetical protein [Providencia rettgeri]MBQ0327222.1 hypothetical protein [Providencia rettgeri]